MDKQAKLKGAKTSRSETVSIRLDPELRYMAEIGARIQRRSLSSFIEWAVSRSLNEIEFTQNFDRDGEPYPVFLQKIRKELWDVDEPDRFVKLAFRNPSLLNHEEQIVWKLVRECGWFWDGWFGNDGIYHYETKEESFHFSRLREWWDRVKSIAQGDSGKEILPKVEQTESSKSEDIPF